MLKNNKGFTFTEALVALNIVLVIIFTVAPIINLIHFEREILYDRRAISSQLHDHLQTVIYANDLLPYEQSEKINNIFVTMTFKIESEYIEACAYWENIKEREEQICLYGLPFNE